MILGRDALDAFVYTYETHYDSSGVHAKTYICRSHVICQARIKIAERKLQKNFELLVWGEHVLEAPLVRKNARPGIALAIKDEVDGLLTLGLGAGRVRNMLLHKYMNTPSKIAQLPTVRQMENRKQYIKTTFGGGWEFDTYAALMSWCGPRMCQSSDVFTANDPMDPATMSDLLVLGTFDHKSTCGGEAVSTFGMIFTSRALMKNILQTVQDQNPDDDEDEEGSLVLSTDGTYRIHLLGWTLVDCGTIAVEFSRNEYVHRFRPWVYMFVRTESQHAYECMFQAVIKYSRVFFGVTVDVRSASIDHSDAIASAIEATWPDCQILTCWPHLVRKARKNAHRLIDKAFFADKILEHLHMLHVARSFDQYTALAKHVMLS